MNNDFVAVLVPGVGCMCVRCGLPTFVNMNAGRGPFEILTPKALQQLHVRLTALALKWRICGDKMMASFLDLLFVIE